MEKKAQIPKKHRTIAMLDRQEVDFLDKLGKDALFSTGHKLTHNDILKALVDLAMELGISGEEVNSPENLKKIIYEVSRRKLDKDFNDMAKKYKEAQDENVQSE